MWPEIDRIVEPFVKAAFARWLLQNGARDVTVSVDGMEARASEFPTWMQVVGFEFEADPRSRATWVGRFGHSTGTVTTCCKPGLDIIATLDDGTQAVGECKGEPTKSGIGSGQDLTALYQCLGQLIVSAGKLNPLPTRRFLVLAHSGRLAPTVELVRQNALVRQAGIDVATVSATGQVTLV